MKFSVLDQMMMGRNESAAGWETADAVSTAAREVEAVFDCTDLIGHIADIPPTIFPYPIPPFRQVAIVGETGLWSFAALVHADNAAVSATIFIHFDDEPVTGPYLRLSWPITTKAPGVLNLSPTKLEGDLPLTRRFVESMDSVVLGTLSAINIVGSTWTEIEIKPNPMISPWFGRRLMVDWDSIESSGEKLGFTDPIAIFHRIQPPNITVDESYIKMNPIAEKGHWLQ